MCIGTWANGKQCTREIRRDGACTVHYENPEQVLKATENFKKCPSPEHKFSDSKYMADFVPNKDFCKKPGDESKLWTNCCFCRPLVNSKRKKAGDMKTTEVAPAPERKESEIKEQSAEQGDSPTEGERTSVSTTERTPYFPVSTAKNKRPPYSEIVKCLESFGFVIQITEEEYNNLKDITKIPALCPGDHGLTNVNIGELRRGSSCCRKCGFEKMKKTNIEKTGFAYPIQNPDTQQKMIQTYQEKKGYDHWNKNPEVQEKTQQTYLAKTGYKNHQQNPEAVERMKQNYLAKTDGKYEFPAQNPEVQETKKRNYLAKTDGKYEWSMQNPEVHEKIKKTNRERTGYDYYLQNPDFRAKIQQAYFEETGYMNPAQNPTSKENFKQTNMERRGVQHHMKDPELVEQMRMNYLEKSGGMYEHPMQDPVIFARVAKSMLKYKPYTYPSGRETLVQGYESFCLDDLIKEGIDENEICNQIELENDIQPMPAIWYEFEGKNRRYYPDIYIPTQNKIIEVKCPWTLKKDLQKNLAKARACIAQGYDFELRIYDRKGIYTVADI